MSSRDIHGRGNVRELIHALEQAFVAAQSEPTLYPKHLPTHVRTHLVRTSIRKKAVPAAPAQRDGDPSPTARTLLQVREEALADAERHYLRDLIEHTKGDIQQACQVSGLVPLALVCPLEEVRHIFLSLTLAFSLRQSR